VDAFTAVANPNHAGTETKAAAMNASTAEGLASHADALGRLFGVSAIDTRPSIAGAKAHYTLQVALAIHPCMLVEDWIGPSQETKRSIRIVTHDTILVAEFCKALNAVVTLATSLESRIATADTSHSGC
jgi:hypothetical protein